jgi:Chaperone of endosialidase
MNFIEAFKIITVKKLFFIALFWIPVFYAAAQNVGINTNTPTRAKLEVFGVAGGGNTSGIFGVGSAGISVQQNWPTIGFNQYRNENVPGVQGRHMANGFAAIQFMDPSTGIMAIDMFPSGTANNYTGAGTRAMTFNPAGNVGIRAGIANASLAVARGDGIDGTAVFQGANHRTNFNYGASEDTYIRSGRDSTKVFLNNLSNGDVLIGNGNTRLFINRLQSTNSSTVEIEDVFNSIVRPLSLTDSYGKTWSQDLLPYQRFVDNAPGINLGFYYQNTYQNAISWVTGTYNYYSDRRLKDNIAVLEPVLTRLRQLTPVSYEMKAENPGHQRSIGFLAQEVKQFFPGAVRVISNHNRKGPVTHDLHTMSYKYFGVLAIQALKEQWQQLKELEQEQALLLSEINTLHQKADALLGR